jgi:HNH endonuclease
MNALPKQAVEPQPDSNKPAYLKYPNCYTTCEKCGSPKHRRSKRCFACFSQRPPIDPFVYIIEGRPCRRIPLTRWLYAIVFESDYDYLMQWVWYAAPCVFTGRFYAKRREYRTQEIITMANQLLQPEKGLIVDHINGEWTLDNRRSNLRIGTQRNNAENTRSHRDSRSRYKGVCFDARYGKWQSTVTPKGKRLFLGYFTGEKAAALAYNRKAFELFGEFARLNEVVISEEPRIVVV